jgi:predicted flap endonuclease-1-like 5' DNA nuclease
MTKLTEVEGIGEKYSEKLIACGVATQQGLLEAGGTPKGRKKIADESGISSTLIMKWINRADLARINGVGSEHADLLECSGVDTVPELAQRNGENLYKKMIAVNEEKKLVRNPPSQQSVVGWVEQAKRMERAINY